MRRETAMSATRLNRLGPRLFAPLIDPVRNALREGANAAECRWELAQLEWAVERRRLTQSIAGLLILALGAVLGMVFVGVAVIVTWWDTDYRVTAAWLVFAAYMLLGLLGLIMWRLAAMRRDQRFSALRAELAADYKLAKSRMYWRQDHHG
jgi:uncharacterized membrane protein YqjE